MAYTQLGRAYNTFDPSLGQSMNAAFLAAVYGQLITPNISDIPGAVSYPASAPPGLISLTSSFSWAWAQTRLLLGQRLTPSWRLGSTLLRSRWPGPGLQPAPCDRHSSHTWLEITHMTWHYDMGH